MFSTPIDSNEKLTAQLDLFLSTHKVLCIDKAPLIALGRQYWSMCVEFLPRRPGAAHSNLGGSSSNSDKPKIDCRQTLTPPQVQRFSTLRRLREQLADSEAVPIYALLTNAQLADMTRKVPKSSAALR